jgi:hypothetical protein
MAQNNVGFGSNMPTDRFGINGAPVNNAGRDPLQGFDADVWVTDQATGRQALIGRFTSIQLTFRNATEPYMEMNQRVARLLDGDFQFSWMLERGLLDTRVFEDTFGFKAVTRELRINRSPRMTITFDLNAQELDEDSGYLQVTGDLNSNELIAEGNAIVPGRQRRKSTGRYTLVFCKVDTLTIGAVAGRSVIATRWEGLAEGIVFRDDSQAWAGVVLPTAVAQVGTQLTSSIRLVNGGRPSWLTEAYGSLSGEGGLNNSAVN